MPLTPSLRALRWAGWATLLLSLPARADTASMTADFAHLLTTVWAPATAYGLALLTAFNKAKK